MRFFEILVEGASDVPMVEEILSRKFRLRENEHFRIHPHRGKGKLPANPLSKPGREHQGLLDQLPAKLRGYGRSLAGSDSVVVVLIDADEEDCKDLKYQLIQLYENLDHKPLKILFRIAVEETESWFLADRAAVKAGYPNARINKIPDSPADSVIGAWERLAEVLGRRPDTCSGADKIEWARAIAPHMRLDEPLSPSLQAFIRGLEDRIGEP